MKSPNGSIPSTQLLLQKLLEAAKEAADDILKSGGTIHGVVNGKVVERKTEDLL